MEVVGLRWWLIFFAKLTKKLRLVFNRKIGGIEITRLSQLPADFDKKNERLRPGHASKILEISESPNKIDCFVVPNLSSFTIS